MAYTFGQASQNTQNTQSEEPKTTGYTFGQAGQNIITPEVSGVQEVVQSVARPFLKTASSVRDIASSAKGIVETAPGAVEDLIRIAAMPKEERAAALANISQGIKAGPTPAKEYDYGYFGKQKAIQNPKEAIGVGTEVASYIPAGGAVVSATKQTLARTLPKLIPLAKEGAVSGGMQMFGSSLQDDKGAVDTLKDTATGALVGGIAAPIIGVTGGAAAKPIIRTIDKLAKPLETHRRDVAQYINQALSTQGKKSIGVALKNPDKQYRAFEVLHDISPNIKVTNDLGEEIVWDPKTTNFADFGKAFKESKDQIWKGVSGAVQEATGKGLNVDIYPILDEVNKIANNRFTTSEVRSGAVKLSEELANMADINGQIPIEGLMEYNKTLNTKIGGVLTGTTDNAVRDMEAGIAKKLSEAADNAVESVTDSRFAKLKDDYAALRSIEKDVVRRMQQESRMIDNSLGDFMGRYGTIEMVNGVIQATHGNFGPLAKGAAAKALGAYSKFLRQPSTYLQRAFREIDRYKSGTGFENAAARGVKTVKETLKKNPKGMINFGAEVFPSKLPPYKETGNLTTKILKDLEGKSTVSKQYILDATNRGELKQQERDIIRQMLDGEGDTVNVADFAKKVKAELLPLQRNMVGSNYPGATPYASTRAKYENITLPKESRGSVKDYSEHVYESPIKTSAGNVHFSSTFRADSGYNGKGFPNYFGHTRIEDMADNQTRRVIEVQSDLYQKEGIEAHIPKSTELKTTNSAKALKDLYDMAIGNGKSEEETLSALKKAQPQIIKDAKSLKDVEKIIEELSAKSKGDETIYNQSKAKLSQYSNPTAHFRMVREEIKKAAEDGKTKLQFPTGTTAMKIEGLGQNTQWIVKEVGNYDGLRPDNLKVGLETYMAGQEGQKWIITDVLGDGKFKARKIPNNEYLKSTFPEYGMGLINKEQAMVKYLAFGGERTTETFDISGKVDTNNPIYRFYEKDLGRYLTSKYGAKTITDDKGVNWYEVAIDKKKHSLPVEAFSAVPMSVSLPTLNRLETEKEYEIDGREAKITEKDLNELGAILYGEIGSRGGDKDVLEARVIANVLLNRMESDNPSFKGKTATELLQAPKQFQAYKSKLYEAYKKGEAEGTERMEAIKKVLNEIRSGKLHNPIGDETFYGHNKDNTIRVYKSWKKDYASAIKKGNIK